MSVATPGEWQREVVRASDLRLLVPALVGWALLASTLTRPPTWRWAVCMLLAVGVGAGVATAVVRRAWWRGSWGRGVLLVVGVTLLLQVAGAGQHALRTTGDLDTLTAARAVVVMEATVTSDPFTPAPRAGREPVVMLRASAHEVTGRGRTSAAHAPWRAHPVTAAFHNGERTPGSCPRAAGKRP